MLFKNITGQEKALECLNRYLSRGTLRGGFIFSGPEGVGKSSAAIELAKALNCQKEDGAPCGECPSCLKIDKNTHPDVYFIDHNTPITIEESFARDDDADSEAILIGHIRQLKKNISLRPYEGRVKVFIIDGAHKLTPKAANAFLKILEEPPENSLIILITDKPKEVIKTISSRCKTVKFAALDREALAKMLYAEHGLNKSDAHFLAYFSEGRIGNALKLKDSAVLSRKNRAIDAFALASTPRGTASFAAQNREDLRSALGVLASWYRDIYVLKAGSDQNKVINLDRIPELEKQAGRFSYVDLDRSVAAISECLFLLERNLNIRLLLNNLGAQLWKG